MAMHQVRCPRCGQSYWQGQRHVCPPQSRPQQPPRKRQTPRYADWRVNFLLNFGVYLAICIIIGQVLMLYGVWRWWEGIVAFMDWLSGLASGP